jgi:hypothetical protein
MHAVSIRYNAGYGFTKATFNIEEEWKRYNEDSGVI